MITARGLAEVLTPALVELLHAGDDRPVSDLELVEPGVPGPVEPTDVFLAVGLTSPDQATDLVERVAGTAGLVVRRELADASVVAACREVGLPLLGLAPGTGWSTALTLLRGAVERAGLGGEADTGYGELFTMADRFSAVIGAPVTIEDAQSRVLAYSTGQQDVDAARLSTIVGRTVPQEVRDHFRSLGVFRRIVRSDDPVYVPAGPNGIRPRYVVPVRAGGEWLGSVWAVVEGPVDAGVETEARSVAQVLALHLLRLRGRSELSEQLHAEQVRALLREPATSRPDFLAPGPRRVVALHGPGHRATDTARRALWGALLRRQGWRRPLLTELGDVTYAVVDDSTETPGSWPWLSALVSAEAARDPSVWATAGGPAHELADLPRSAAHAAEQHALGRDALPGPASTAEQCWAEVTLARARRAVGEDGRPGPLAVLRSHDVEHRTAYVATLAAVLAHWGNQKVAARVLGVHPNSVRLRMARVHDLVDLDLEDPRTRLALQLLLAG